MSQDKIPQITDSDLGRKSNYPKVYSPDILFSIPRSANRDKLSLSDSIPFHGFDLWNFYEISFLNSHGLPVVAVGYALIPCTSHNLIESKSLKLYLNSFNFSSFTSVAQVQKVIQRDLAKALCIDTKDLKILITPVSSLESDKCFFINNSRKNGNHSKLESVGQLDLVSRNGYSCLEEEFCNIFVSNYDYCPELLTLDKSDTEPKDSLHLICSHLLKSNCLVTGQPDWGTVFIKYRGNKIDHEALLRYIISFRNHNEFHEMCVERIFTDILNCCKPEQLTVFARYTRRGGIDINPFRSNFETLPDMPRTIRQ